MEIKPLWSGLKIETEGKKETVSMDYFVSFVIKRNKDTGQW